MTRRIRPARAGHPDGSFHLVGSRRRAFEPLRSAVLLGTRGPILITGEPGAGKTALVRRFAAEDPAQWRTATVDLAAEMNALEFLRLVGHAARDLVNEPSGKGTASRWKGALANEAAEGRRWLLVVDRGPSRSLASLGRGASDRGPARSSARVCRRVIHRG